MPSLVSGKGIVVCIATCICVCFGCGQNSDDNKKLAFKVDTSIIKSHILKIIDFENLAVEEINYEVNYKFYPELSITIVNPSNLPSENSALRILAKSICKEFKNNLSDQNQFLGYRICFRYLNKQKQIIPIRTFVIDNFGL